MPAPSSSSASCVRPFTVAAVPTGMNTGVSIVPCGVANRPRRAPPASVFATSNEKFTSSVYQEKIKAHPTPITTKTAHTVSAVDSRKSKGTGKELRPEAPSPLAEINLTMFDGDHKLECRVCCRKADDLHVFQSCFASRGEHVIFRNVFPPLGIDNPERGSALQRFRELRHLRKLLLRSGRKKNPF